MATNWPVIVVTGANQGVGLGICERFLSQLSSPTPSDANLQLHPPVDSSSIKPFPPCEGLTLVLACRNLERAEVARKELYQRADVEIAKRRSKAGDNGHADRFRANLRIELQYIDLADLKTVFKAADELSKKYPYISHLICNAGMVSASHFDADAMKKQMKSSFVLSMTLPLYVVHRKGERSTDGLGWVWQSNTFSHYVLFRALESKLLATAKTNLGPARVLWLTSVEGTPHDYDPEDWQLQNTTLTYGLSKFQIDLVATRLDRTAISEGTPIRHVLVQPGCCGTNMYAEHMQGRGAYLGRTISHYLARWLGSPHHTIKLTTAAFSTVHMSLIPTDLIDIYLSAFADPSNASYFAHSKIDVGPLPHKFSKHEEDGGSDIDFVPGKFGSETDRWGSPRLGMMEVRDWPTFAAESKRLLGKYDELLIAIKKGGQDVTE